MSFQHADDGPADHLAQESTHLARGELFGLKLGNQIPFSDRERGPQAAGALGCDREEICPK
nr:hypothetical protein [Allgaiera indica]